MTPQARKIYGHQGLKDIFLRALQKGRPPHAWLLTGPQGIGKATVAGSLARFLLRHDLSPSEIPGEEPEDALYHQVMSGAHPDFLFIEKEEGKQFIPSETVRHMSTFVQKAGRKVVVLDSLDDLNEKGQNALLKSLEEPVSQTTYFLVSHSPHKILPTIRSRCQEMKAQPLTAPHMKAFIEDQGLDLASQTLTLYEHMARGRLGIFQQLIEQDGQLWFDKLQDCFLEVLSKRSPYPLSNTLSEILSKEEERTTLLFLHMLLWFWHRLTERLSTQNFTAPLTPKEGEIFTHLQGFPLEKWLTAEEKFLNLKHLDQRLKGEPKQALFGMLTALG